MSGGVDSSVAAGLLVEQGYDVIGMMMRLWSEPPIGNSAPVNRCCTPDQMADARRIADSLNIPFYVVDVKERFRQTIVQFFIDEHGKGRTPNPCIECNRAIRFDYLLNRAKALDADYLATGHYARIRATADGFQLLKGNDAGKDQSYVLYMLGQTTLSQLMFPVGEYSKAETREMAEQMGFDLAHKRDSQDLCFLGDGDYRRFLRQYAPDSAEPGMIVNQAGDQLGTHDGLPFYTIGQRKGLQLQSPQPLFVTEKDPANNRLIVGERKDVGRTVLVARNINWVADKAPSLPMPASVKIRYKAREMPAMLQPSAHDQLIVSFEEAVAGVTPGQSSVFYDGHQCLGGGIIADAQLNGAS